MREILFRGQRIDNGEWVEGDLIQIGGGVLIYHGDKQEVEVIKQEDSPCSVGFYPNEISVVIQKTVGQFTGLNDKNGVKIFEGDLLEDKKGSILVIKFGQFEAGKDDFDIAYIPTGFYASFSDGGTYCINSGGGGYAIESKRCSIIGNIHKTPELLK